MKRTIIHKPKSKRYKVKKWKQRHRVKNYNFEPKGATSRFVINPIRTVKKGKKTKILEAIEDIEENLQVPDISEERRQELLEKKEALQQRAKRITGSPPIKLVKGQTTEDIRKGLYNRYMDTSGRMPEFVREMNIPRKNPYGIRTQDITRQRKKSREIQTLPRTFNILSEKAEEAAISGKDVDFIYLDDVKRSKKGRKVIYKSWWF